MTKTSDCDVSQLNQDLNQDLSHSPGSLDTKATILDATAEGDEIITIKMASVILGISMDTLRNMDKDGRLKSYRRSPASFRREYLLSHVLELNQGKLLKIKEAVGENTTYADLILGLNKSVISGKKEDALVFVSKIKKFLTTDYKPNLPPSAQ